MPKIKFTREKKEVECEPGANLRQVAIQNGIQLYHGMSKYFNCRGKSLCGECRVHVIKGMENLSPKTFMEKFTLFRMLSSVGFEDEMRLSCQCKVLGDVTIETQPEMNICGENFWQKPYPNK